MSIQFDPEGEETSALFEFAVSLAGKRVLEIGCGDGRMTWRYAEQVAHLTGIDPKSEAIALARKNTPRGWKRRVRFHAMDLVTYAGQQPSGREDKKFDLVILSWAL